MITPDRIPTTMSFGDYIRLRREEVGLSLGVVSKALGVSKMYLSLMERGMRPPMNPRRWPSLVQAVPGLDNRVLLKLFLRTKPFNMNLVQVPPFFRGLVADLAQWLATADPDDENVLMLRRVISERGHRVGPKVYKPRRRRRKENRLGGEQLSAL